MYLLSNRLLNGMSNTSSLHSILLNLNNANAMMRRTLLLALVVGILFATKASAAESVDNVYYSASNCTPLSAGGFHGSGAEGFRWNISKGGWYNHDQDDPEELICPIPYFRNPENLAPVKVRIVVEDRHNSTAGFVAATLCRQTVSGNADCVASSAVSTSVSFLGKKVLSTSITPSALTRWIWMRLQVPDIDSGDGISGVKGYRVFR